MASSVVRSRAWAWYLAGFVFVAQYYVVSAYGTVADDTLYSVLGISGAVAAIVGLVVQRPRPFTAWLVVAIAVGVYLTADVVLANLEAENVIVPFPSLADWLYLGVSVALVGAFVVIRRSLAPGRDGPATIDALLVGVGALGVLAPLYLSELWNMVFFDTTQRWVAVAYPITDALLLAAGARLVFAGGRRIGPLTLLGAAAVAIVVGNAVYNAEALGAGHQSGGVASVGWLAFTALLGAAVLHPATRADVPSSSGPRWPSGIRWVAPVAVVAAHLRWGDADSRLLTVACLITIVVLGALRGRIAGSADASDGRDASEVPVSPLHPADTDFLEEVAAVPTSLDDTPPALEREPWLDEPSTTR